MNHTPGPWKVVKRVGGECCIIPVHHEKHSESWILAECREQANDEANARLIAAAPELLEALEHITQCYAELHEGDGEENEAFIASMRAVITKAKGAS